MYIRDASNMSQIRIIKLFHQASGKHSRAERKQRRSVCPTHFVNTTVGLANFTPIDTRLIYIAVATRERIQISKTTL